MSTSCRSAWTFSTGVLRGHEGAPLVIGDVMYLHAPFPNTVFALDLNNDGKILWKYEPKQDPNVIPVMCCDTVNRGLAYADGKIFLHQADTTLVALDAKTGKVVWSVKDGDPSQGRDRHGRSARLQGQGFHRRVRRRVRRSRLGQRLQHQGRQAGLARLFGRARIRHAGRPAKRPPRSASRSARIRASRPGKAINGRSAAATPGAGISYDPALNLIYYGSGNPSTWNPKQRPGDNKWSMTIWARDADTGMAKWVYQMTPHDEWDYDGVNEMILTDQKIDGKDRKLLSISTATASATRSIAPPANCWSPRSSTRR